MKIVLFALITLLINIQTSFAQALTCEQVYSSKFWHKPKIGGEEGPGMLALETGLGGFIGSGFIVALTGASLSKPALISLGIGTIGPVLILTTMGVGGATVLIHNSRPKKMLKLIKQAENYALNENLPGNLLIKLWKKTGKKTNLKDLAKMIVKGNKDLSLCTGDPTYFRSLVKMVKDGQAVIVNDQDNLSENENSNDEDDLNNECRD